MNEQTVFALVQMGIYLAFLTAGWVARDASQRSAPLFRLSLDDNSQTTYRTEVWSEEHDDEDEE